MSMFDPTSPPGAFRLEATRLTGWLLGAYGLLWLLTFLWMTGVPELLPAGVALPGSWIEVADGPEGTLVRTTVPATDLLVLHPPGSEVGPVGFRWWQLLTAPLLHPHRPGLEVGQGFSWSGLLLEPRGFAAGGLATWALGALGLLFFAAPVQRFLGTRSFLQLWVAAGLGSLLGALLVGWLFRPQTVHFGFGPSVLAVMLVACLITPEAKVRILMVVDVPMKAIAGVIVFATVARLLALSAPAAGRSAGGYELGGLVAGYLWWRYRDYVDFDLLRRRRRTQRALRLAVDNVLSGASSSDPTVH